MEDRYLFKAKRTDNEEWVTGSLITCGDGTCKIATRYLDDSANIAILICVYDVDRETICQCTGLKDKNGKLIWENDVVRGKMHGNYGYRKLVGVVQYYIDAFKVNVKPNSFWGDYKNISNACEVIGNIFDNKELLESEG